jgi:hypothetical protein
MTTKKDQKEQIETVTISAPNIQRAQFNIIGTAPYVQLRFSAKAMNKMREQHEAGSKAKNKRAKEPRDFNDDFVQAQHVSIDGWNGIPASAFRKALISACRLVNFKMTLAKLSIFVEADGYDVIDAEPLIKITGEPESLISTVRNATGVADLRVRAKFWPWSAVVNIRYDADQFTAADVANLLARVGLQVGIGEGRPDGKESAGMGWGTFEVK